jgi:hypothetical protein
MSNLKSSVLAVVSRFPFLGASTLMAFIAIPLVVGIWSACHLAYRNAVWTVPNIEESRRRGERIAEALLECQDKTGRLPSSLEGLVPKFLDRIPEPVAGLREWEYQLTPDSRQFSLVFRQQRGILVFSFVDCRGERWTSGCKVWMPFD